MSRTTARRLLSTSRAALSAALALSALAAGCSASASNGGDGPVKIGGSLGLTGSLAGPAA